MEKAQKVRRSGNITIIARDDIPAITSIEQDGKKHELGEIRDFQWHEALKNFMPPTSELSISWACLQKDEVLPTHVHPTQSMMVFYKGSGKMLGQKSQTVAAGQVVAVPAGCEHGFIGGLGGLHAFSIQFGPGLYTHPEEPRVVFAEDKSNIDQLMVHNEQRLEQFLKKPFFNMLKDGTLQDPKKWDIFLNCMKIWVEGHNTPWFSQRQSVQQNIESEFFDPILESIVDWFLYQMLVLDHFEKAIIVHWVIEKASAKYHKLAKPHFPPDKYKKYFHLHLKIDKKDTSLDKLTLLNQTPATYRRLKDIINQSWDMLETMVDRVFDLTSK